MQALNEDDLQELIKKLRYDDIVALCSINKSYNDLCNDDFWKNYVVLNYEVDRIINDHKEYFFDAIMDYVYNYRNPDEIEGLEDLTAYDKWNFFLDTTPNKKWQELAYGLEYSKTFPRITFFGTRPIKYEKILVFPYDYINNIVGPDDTATSLIGNKIGIIYNDALKIVELQETFFTYTSDYENIELKMRYGGAKVDAATKFMEIKINGKPLLDYLELVSVIEFE
jgi:hypothetical protein